MLKEKISSYSVLLLSVIALLAPVAWIEYGVLQYTHGTIAYPQDDTFIHMAVAKNLAFEHVWGISKYSFESASSSPFYTVLLAAIFWVTGTHLIIPLLVNIVAAIFFLVVVQRWLIRQGVSGENQLLILILTITLTPLPLLVISGMEHTLQLLFCFLFIYTFSEAVNGPIPGKLPRQVYLYGLLMVSTRYETMSMVTMACLLLVFRRNWWTALKLGFISLLPIVLFGCMAMSKGSYFMPNSVLLKSAVPPLTLQGLEYFFSTVLWYKLLFVSQNFNILATQRLLLILPLVYILFRDPIRQYPAYRDILIILMGAVLAHVSFAYYSTFPRYEAYLIGCSLIISGTLIIRHGRDMLGQRIKGTAWITWPLLVILAIPLLFRCLTTFGDAELSCINIHDQQYQMARFIHIYYYNTPIALNDIGAVSYCSEGRKLDLIGIASLDVMKSKRQHYWSPAFADSLSHRQNVRVAMVYDSWFSPALLHRWKKIASWQIRNNVIAGDDSVSFYSINPSDTATLRKNLREFQKSLPAEVIVRYY